jgi:hypothetical protein
MTLRLLSLAHLTVLDADPVALVDAGSAGGFDAIGLRVVPPLPTDAIVPVVGDATMQRRIKERLAETGLGILDIEAVWLQPHTNVEALRPALEVGVDLGARYVLSVGFDEDRARLVDNFGAFCALAQDCGLRTMLEFIPFSSVTSLKDAHDLLLAARPTNAGLLVDALHLSRSGGNPRDIAYDPWPVLLYPSLRRPEGSCLRDQLRGSAGRRSYPGEGQLWLDAFWTPFPVEGSASVSSLGQASPAERAGAPDGRHERFFVAMSGNLALGRPCTLTGTP